MAVEEQFKINLNQNLWVLAVTYVAVGGAEYWHLGHLLWLARIAATTATISTVLTLAAYTWNYCKHKFRD